MVKVIAPWVNTWGVSEHACNLMCISGERAAAFTQDASLFEIAGSRNTGTGCESRGTGPTAAERPWRRKRPAGSVHGCEGKLAMIQKERRRRKKTPGPSGFSALVLRHRAVVP